MTEGLELAHAQIKISALKEKLVKIPLLHRNNIHVVLTRSQVKAR